VFASERLRGKKKNKNKTRSFVPSKSRGEKKRVCTYEFPTISLPSENDFKNLLTARRRKRFYYNYGIRVRSIPSARAHQSVSSRSWHFNNRKRRRSHVEKFFTVFTGTANGSYFSRTYLNYENLRESSRYSRWVHLSGRALW
jgi:hypothetical protein